MKRITIILFILFNLLSMSINSNKTVMDESSNFKAINFYPERKINEVIPPSKVEVLDKFKNEFINSSDEKWLLNFNVNPLSRLLMIKINYVDRVVVAIKNKNDGKDFVYNIDNFNKKIVLVPIKYLYNNYENIVEIKFLTETGLKLKIINLKIQTENLKNFIGAGTSLEVEKPLGIKKLSNNLLFWTSGNFQYPRAYDKWGELRWVAKINSGQETVTSWRNEDDIIIGAKDINLPIQFSSFYKGGAYVIDSLGLQKRIIDVSEYGQNHDFIQFNKNTYYTIGSNPENNYDTSNSSLIEINFQQNNKLELSNVTLINLVELFKNTLNHDFNEPYDLYNQILNYEDVLHLNSLKKLDEQRLFVAARAIQSLFIINVSNKKLPYIEKVITSSKELFSIYKNNSENFKKYFISYPDEVQAMVGAHDFLPLDWDKDHFLKFEFLDNQNPFFAISKKIINLPIYQEKNYSYHSIVTLKFDSEIIQINMRKKLPHSRFRGSVFSSFSAQYEDYINNCNNVSDYYDDKIYASFMAEPTNKLVFYHQNQFDNKNDFIVSYKFSNLFRVTVRAYKTQSIYFQ